MNHESPQPQSIPLRPFQIFLKIHGDICKSWCTTGINETGGKFAIYRRKICHRYKRQGRQIFPPVLLVFANLPPVSTTPVANCHLYQRHRRQICHWWQTMRKIIKLLTTYNEFEEKKFIYMLTLLPKGVQKK